MLYSKSSSLCSLVIFLELGGYSGSVQGEAIWRTIQSSLESKQGQMGTVVASASDTENSVLLCRWKSLFFEVKCKWYAFSQITLFKVYWKVYIKKKNLFIPRKWTILLFYTCILVWVFFIKLLHIGFGYIPLNSFLALNSKIMLGRVSAWQAFESLWISGFHKPIGQILLKLILSVQELFCSLDVDLV